MHDQAKNFTLYVRRILTDYFINKKVLDVGSGDINGNNRFLFVDCRYDGNDVTSGNNVTIVSRTKDLQYESEFDTIISTECFEHDPEYKESVLNIYRMLKPGGLFVFTCASEGRAEHGTARTRPVDSFAARSQVIDMQDYYKNLNIADINDVLKLDDSFIVWKSYYNSLSHDLYFFGIKKGTSADALKSIDFPLYNDVGVRVVSV